MTKVGTQGETSDNNDWQRGNDGSGEHERDDLGGTYGIGTEDMVDPLELAVTQWLRRCRMCSGGGCVALDGDVEDSDIERSGGAKGTKNNRRLDGKFGVEKL